MLWPITYVRFDTSEMISYIPLGFALADAVTRVILDKEAEIDAGAGAQLKKRQPDIYQRHGCGQIL